MKKNVFIVFLLLSCGDGKSASDAVQTINIDLTTSRSIDFDSRFNPIALTDNSDSVYIGGFNSFVTTKNSYIISTKNNLVSYDMNTGVQNVVFAEKGSASNEYNNVSSLWFDGDTLNVFDINSSKILRFMQDGSYLGQVKMGDNRWSFNDLVKTKDGYFGTRMYTGVETSRLAKYDNNLNHIKDIGDLKNNTGVSIGYPFYYNGSDDVLFVAPFCNTIYSISDSCDVKVKYDIDFGEHNIPDHLADKDEIELINYLQENELKFSFIHPEAYESKKFLCFSCSLDQTIYFVVYDKKDKKVNLFNFINSDDAMVVFSCFRDDCLIVISQNMSNTTIGRIELKELLN